MIGLIRNNFYSMESNLMISLILAAALGFSPLIISDGAIYPVIIAVQIFLFVANTGTALHADELAKWNEFELTLPVRRSTVIGAKYVTFAALILCGLAISLCTVVCIRASGQTWDLSSILWGLAKNLPSLLVGLDQTQM